MEENTVPLPDPENSPTPLPQAAEAPIAQATDKMENDIVLYSARQ